MRQAGGSGGGKRLCGCFHSSSCFPGIGRQCRGHAGLYYDYSGDCIPGAGTVQQAAVRPLSCFSVHFFAVAWTAVWIILGAFGQIAPFWILELIVARLLGLIGLVLWLLLLLKAYQGVMWKLPIIGALAEEQAGKPPADMKAA